MQPVDDNSVSTQMVDRRARALFHQHQESIFRRTDHLFAWLMMFQWLAAIVTALVISPRTWIGTTSETHIHVWAALFLGGAISSLPIWMAFARPGTIATRHVIALGQMLMGALLIHLTGGRLETHFHVFGSLAFLAFYRDWRVLITASAVVAMDHAIRGSFWPQSVYGVITPNVWRWLEHTGWVVFEDVFLVISCLQSVREMKRMANRQAQLEGTHERIELTVLERTAALRASEIKYRRIIETANEGIWAFDTLWRTDYINQRMAEMLGYRVEEMLGCSIDDFLDAHSPAEAKRDPEQENAYFRDLTDVTLMRKDGSKLLASVSSSRINDPDGAYAGTLAMAIDVTNRRRSEGRQSTQHAIARILGESASLTTAAPKILESICTFLEWGLGVLWLVDQEADVLRCLEVWHIASGEHQEFKQSCEQMTFARGVGLPGRIWSSGKPAWIADVSADGNFPRLEIATGAGLHGAFGFPIIAGAEVYGVIEFFSRKIEQPDSDLLDMMGTIGSQIVQFVERTRAEDSLRASEARLRAMFEAAPDSVITIDRMGRILDLNSAAVQAFGYERAVLLGQSVEMMISERFREAHRQGLARCDATGDGPLLNERIEIAALRADGTEFPAELTITRIALDGPPMYTAYLRDVTERKRAQERLEYQAMHDTLTDLPNRTLFQEHLEHCLATSRRNCHSFALLLIDLDRFKEINDTLGHRYGDIVLKQVAARFQAVLRDSDMFARLGGDEFTILLPETDEQCAILVAERILGTLKLDFILDAQPFDVGASIGIAIFPQHGDDAASLLRLADVAMYAAKGSEAGYVAYKAENNQYTPRRLALVGELRHGIDNHQLLLHYQPKIDLKTMRVKCAEALVRWQHPRDGLMSPAQFIPLAQRTGLIKPLSLWVLNTALLQCRVWRRAGINAEVAVNLPPTSLQDPELMNTIARLIDDNDALPSWLTVEITESAMMADTERAATILRRLKEMGIRISIDDFGTGHSSLAYLKAFPVDEVKIDRSFIKDMMTTKGASAIVSSVIELAHAMGLQVVAEGVEDEETLDSLIAQGCDMAQGFFLCRPLPPAEFNDWIIRSGARFAASKLQKTER